MNLGLALKSAVTLAILRPKHDRNKQCAIEPPPTRPASPGPARPPPSGSCIPHCEICYIWPDFQVTFPVLNPQTKKTRTPSTIRF